MQLKDFLNSINFSKENLIDGDSKVEKLYLPFIVNKCMSYFPDTIFTANQANGISHTDRKMQYDYLLNSIRPKKRFAPWQKKVEDSELDLIKAAYGVSEKKALEIMAIITPEKMDIIRKSQYTGGHK
jgi:Bacteriophage clamp loader A subunit